MLVKRWGLVGNPRRLEGGGKNNLFCVILKGEIVDRKLIERKRGPHRKPRIDHLVGSQGIIGVACRKGEKRGTGRAVLKVEGSAWKKKAREKGRRKAHRTFPHLRDGEV